mgnify:CR=1 FL=1
MNFDKGEIKSSFGNVDIGIKNENLKVLAKSSFGNIEVFGNSLGITGKTEKVYGLGDSKVQINSNFGNVVIRKLK